MDSGPEGADRRPWNYADAVALTFLLYLCGYYGGLVANIWFLIQARRYRQHTGEKPPGIGCLWAMLILGLIPFIAMIAAIVTGTLFPEGEYTLDSLRRTFNF